MCAEWEPAYGTLIRWPLGIPSTLVVELAADDSLYVLVETAGQESQARSAFAGYGVNLDHVRFIRANTYSHWTRDWGPHSVFDGEGRYGITDPYFDGYPWVPGCFIDAGPRATTTAAALPRQGVRGYEEDDAVNAVLAAEFGCPLHELPAYCTGGNIMCDGQGGAFSTRQMYLENAPLWSEAQFRQLAEEYLGIHTYHLVDKPEVHGIQHIDCYAKLLDEETVLIKEVAPGHEEYACIEHLVDEIAALTNGYGRPYRIERVYCGSLGGSAVAAYTNSLILNEKVLVPVFGIGTDDAALETYREIMPGYEVIGFYSSSWYYYDALHCRTMGIFDRQMLRMAHRRLDREVEPATEYPIEVFIDDRSETGLVSEALNVFWRQEGAPQWQRLPLEQAAGADSFRAALPGQPPQTTVEYYVAAADSSGRSETLPPSAPEGCYRFTILGDPAGAQTYSVDVPPLRFHPNPFQGKTTVRLEMDAAGEVDLAVLDAAGRIVNRWRVGFSRDRGAATILWDGTDGQGRTCPAGMYLFRAGKPGRPKVSMGRCLLIR